jgi:hypothetical protein
VIFLPSPSCAYAAADFLYVAGVSGSMRCK